MSAGSAQVKAKLFCDWGSRGIEMKAILRSRREKWEVSEGVVERRMQKVGTYQVKGNHCQVVKLEILTQAVTPTGFLSCEYRSTKGGRSGAQEILS